MYAMCGCLMHNTHTGISTTYMQCTSSMHYVGYMPDIMRNVLYVYEPLKCTYKEPGVFGGWIKVYYGGYYLNNFTFD